MLNQSQLSQFNESGFLIIENVLHTKDLDALRSEYLELVNQIALDRGHKWDDWSVLNVDQKLTRLIAQDPEAYEHLDISLPLKPDINLDTGVHTGPAVFELLTHPRLLDITQSIMGPEIYSNPVQHVRIKPPESALSEDARGSSNMARTGWHQDAAVIVESADAAPILTVWVAITDATPEMGCMQAIPGSHRWSALGQHCPGRSGVGEIFIPPELVGQHKPVNLDVRAGGVVLLHKKTWHGAGPNLSERVRWSFDLRYQPPGFSTGRECFPEFLARSVAEPNRVLQHASEWTTLWDRARTEIANGQRHAVFNERWNHNRNDPLCA